MKIGIFDTGRGGELVAHRIAKQHPEHRYTVVNDRDNLPYGTKSSEEIIRLTDTAIQPLLTDCEVIILACNTATAAAIDVLRDRYPHKSFIGFEPMIKPSSELSKSGVVSILATQSTRRSARYQALKNRYGRSMKILEPVTDGWAELIEQRRTEEIDLSEVIADIDQAGSDIIALACTHYLDLENRLKTASPQHVRVIEPTDAVIKQLRRLTAEARELSQ